MRPEWKAAGGHTGQKGVSSRTYLGGPALASEVAGQRYALPVEHVIQVVEMLSITPLPAVPEIVVGVINYRGRVIPVVDMRRRLCQPTRTYTLRTPILVAQIDGRATGLIVDAVSGVVGLQPEQVEIPGQIFTGGTARQVQPLAGVARLSDGLILILDLTVFLYPEEGGLERALSRRRGRKKKD